MIDNSEQEFEYKGYHMRVDFWHDEYVGEIIETGEEVLANKIEWLVESFHEVVEDYLFAEKFHCDLIGAK